MTTNQSNSNETLDDNQVKKHRHFPEHDLRQTRWNKLAALQINPYTVENYKQAIALRIAIMKLGYYARIKRTNQGIKVYKLEMVK